LRPKLAQLEAKVNESAVACSNLDEEEGGEAGRRKFPGVGVVDVIRMFGRWLRRL